MVRSPRPMNPLFLNFFHIHCLSFLSAVPSFMISWPFFLYFPLTSQLVSMPPVFPCSLHPTLPCQIYLFKIKYELRHPLGSFCSVLGAGFEDEQDKVPPSGQCYSPSVAPWELKCQGHWKVILRSIFLLFDLRHILALQDSDPRWWNFIL